MNYSHVSCTRSVLTRSGMIWASTERCFLFWSTVVCKSFLIFNSMSIVYIKLLKKVLKVRFYIFDFHSQLQHVYFNSIIRYCLEVGAVFRRMPSTFHVCLPMRCVAVRKLRSFLTKISWAWISLARQCQLKRKTFSWHRLGELKANGEFNCVYRSKKPSW